MPRPRIKRRILFEPGVTYYKPAGVPVRSLEEVELGLDGIEALRLSDVIGLSQDEAAEKMGVSQPTFHRILDKVRKKVADALINGKAIKILKK
ncbi:MAG: DUF134 domain-containing protein [Nanoarchaeota archaeon]|nr:DUF134 domain-containing protein [Nanoarchaeota archaeon]